MAVSKSELIGLYLAYFGRPPDINGVNFYTSNPAFTIQTVAAGFSASPESQALYGTTFGLAQINAIYQNLFNRDAEAAGLTYWSGEVSSGRINPAEAALAIYLGAQNADKVSVANKILVSTNFLAMLDTPAEALGYSGTLAAQTARTFLHTVDSTASSLTIATAMLTTQVGYATGLIAQPFAVTKDANNIVSFAHAGTAIAVTASAGTFTFATTGGNSGSGTATGTISGISVPAGTTLSISSLLAGSKAFTGAGSTQVIAAVLGEDLSINLTATGVSGIQLTSGHAYTMTKAQADIAKIGAGGTLGTIIDTATMTVIDTLANVGGGVAASLKTKGADIVIATVATPSNISSTTVTGVDKLELAGAGSYTLTAAQAALITSAPGTQNITLTSVATALTLNATVETFTVGNFANSVTMGAVGQVIVGGSGVDTVTAITGVTSSSDLKAGANVVVVTSGANVSGGAFTATGGTVGYNINAAATATLNAAQAALITTATGIQNITLSNAATGLTLNSAVETFTLGNFANTVTLGAAAQNVTGGNGADTITIDGLVATGLISNFEALHVAATSTIASVDFGAALGTLTMAANTGLSMTIAQNEALSGSATVSGAGQSVTLTDAGVVTAIAGIETYNLAAGANDLTTGSSGQIINADALADGDLLTLSGANNAIVTLVSGDLDSTSSASNMTVAATSGSNGVSTGSGNDTIDTGAGDDTVDAGDGANTITGGAGSDNITLGAGADTIVFNSLSGVDSIVGFDVANDAINLSKAVFDALGAVGALATAEFEAGAGLTAAATAEGRIVYDTTTGDLYYDADGSGAGAVVLIGTVTGAPTLTFDLINIIA